MTQVSPIITENYGPQDWLAIAQTKSQSLHKVRESALAWWARANGFQDPELLFSLIKSKEQDPYQAAKNMVDLLTRERAKTTASGQPTSPSSRAGASTLTMRRPWRATR